MIKKEYASQCSSKPGLQLSAKDCKIVKCDRTCINSTINICQHVIAVAEIVVNCLVLCSDSGDQNQYLY